MLMLSETLPIPRTSLSVDNGYGSTSMNRRSLQFSTERLSTSLEVVQSRRSSRCNSPLATHRRSWLPMYASYLDDGPLNAFARSSGEGETDDAFMLDSDVKGRSSSLVVDHVPCQTMAAETEPCQDANSRRTLGKAVRKGLSILRRRSTRRATSENAPDRKSPAAAHRMKGEQYVVLKSDFRQTTFNPDGIKHNTTRSSFKLCSTSTCDSTDIDEDGFERPRMSTVARKSSPCPSPRLNGKDYLPFQDRKRAFSLATGLSRSNHELHSRQSSSVISRSPYSLRTRPSSTSEMRGVLTPEELNSFRDELSLSGDGSQRSRSRLSFRGHSKYIPRSLGTTPSASLGSLVTTNRSWDRLALLDRKWSSLAVTQNIEGLQAMIQDEPAIINRKDFIYGYTALHWGAKLNNIKMVNLLLKHHACVDIASNSGITPLHLAARHGCSDIVHILIEANANCDVRDCSGKQPKDVASSELSEDAREMLVAHLRKTVVLQYGRPLTVDEKVALGLMARPITVRSEGEPTALGLRGRLRTIAYKKNKAPRVAPSQSILSVVAEDKTAPRISKSLLSVSTLGFVDHNQIAKPHAQTLV